MNEVLDRRVRTIERIVDAVLLAEANETVGASRTSYDDAVRDTYSADQTFAKEWGAVITAALLSALQGADFSTPGSAINAVTAATGGLVGTAVREEINGAVPLVLLLAQQLATNAGVTTGEVLREVLDALREVATNG